MSFRFRALALLAMGGRYSDAIAHHWRQRHTATRKSFTRSEAEFLPSSLALIERPVSPTARASGLLIVVLLALGILWASLGRVDIIVTAAGKVIQSSRAKIIASVDVASVRALHVAEGKHVTAGDVLVELDAGTFEADERKAEVEVRAARLQVARARALLNAIDTNRPPLLRTVAGITGEDLEQARSDLAAQYRDYEAQLTQLDGEIDRYSQALPLVQARAHSYAELVKTHDVSANAWSEKQQAAIDLDGQLAHAQNSRTSLIAQTRRDALDSLTSAAKIVASSIQDAARARSHVRLLSLRSPVDGTVQELQVHTLGGVVPAAQPLMKIVPSEDTVEVEGYIENKDIGFVHVGQHAEVKVDAFDYTRHGMIDGRVSFVSRDAVQDPKRGLTYKTDVRLERPYIFVDGRPAALEPGMTTEVEIKTGRRRLIDYVLSPLRRHEHESLHER